MNDRDLGKGILENLRGHITTFRMTAGVTDRRQMVWLMSPDIKQAVAQAAEDESNFLTDRMKEERVFFGVPDNPPKIVDPSTLVAVYGIQIYDMPAKLRDDLGYRMLLVSTEESKRRAMKCFLISTLREVVYYSDIDPLFEVYLHEAIKG